MPFFLAMFDRTLAKIVETTRAVEAQVLRLRDQSNLVDGLGRANVLQICAEQSRPDALPAARRCNDDAVDAQHAAARVVRSYVFLTSF